MPQLIPFLALMLVRTLSEESTPSMSSIQSLKNIAQIESHSFWPNQLTFNKFIFLPCALVKLQCITSSEDTVSRAKNPYS